jgi:hypothetical protein
VEVTQVLTVDPLACQGPVCARSWYRS